MNEEKVLTIVWDVDDVLNGLMREWFEREWKPNQIIHRQVDWYNQRTEDRVNQKMCQHGTFQTELPEKPAN